MSTLSIWWFPPTTERLAEGQVFYTITRPAEALIRNWLDRVEQAKGNTPKEAIKENPEIGTETRSTAKSWKAGEPIVATRYKTVRCPSGSYSKEEELGGQGNPYWEATCNTEQAQQRHSYCIPKQFVAQKLFEYGLWAKDPQKVTRADTKRLAEQLVAVPSDSEPKK